MFHPTMIGIVLWIVSGLLFLMKMLSKLMKRDFHFFSIKEIYGLEWIEKIPFDAGQQAMTYISTVSISSILFVAGLLFILFNRLKNKSFKKKT